MFFPHSKLQPCILSFFGYVDLCKVFFKTLDTRYELHSYHNCKITYRPKNWNVNNRNEKQNKTKQNKTKHQTVGNIFIQKVTSSRFQARLWKNT